MKAILQKDSTILRKIARDVPVENIATAKIQKIITEMKEALASQDDGVAIAAPQIGYDLRMFVVAGRFFSDADPETAEAKQQPDLVFINPVIMKLSKTKKEMEEGCLSVRYMYGKVQRATKATVIAHDEQGKKFTRGGSGLMAQVFQHEVDHLNGILFIDKAVDVEEIKPKEKVKIQK